MSRPSDVFLSHNSRDKPVVREIAHALEGAGIGVWLDEWDLTPGRPWQEELEKGLGTAKSVAVFVGTNGIGRWVEPEMRAALAQSVDRGVSVIPVLLPGGPKPADLPIFLKAYTCVDMRAGITEPTLWRLQCGIRGVAPRVGRTRQGHAIILGEADLVVVQSSNAGSESKEPFGSDPRGSNPYRGLLAFHEEDADRFFGREEQVARLWKLFREQHEPPPFGEGPFRLLPVLGPSGSGKSSVARAGLIPELARHPLPGWKNARVAVVTPGAHPLESLAVPLARIATGDSTPVAKTREFRDEMKRPNEDGTFDGLRRIANALPDIASSPLIVTIDQFEEVFSLCKDEAEREAFIENLLQAVTDAAANVSAIITLRTDFLDETQKHARLNGAIARQGVIIPGMNEEQLRRAITEPARLAGHPLDDSTVGLLINETKDREGALPLLQFALQQIWEGLAGGIEPSETLKAIGGVGGALAGEAQRIYESLPEVDRKIARRVFLGLVQLGEGTRDTRRRTVVASLIAFADDPKRVEDVVRRFASPGVRLITLSANPDGSEAAEVTHEALFEHWQQLDEWLERGRDDLRFQRRLDQAARHWDSQSRAEGLLWRPPDLDILSEFQQRRGDDMTPTQLEFFRRSLQDEQRRVDREIAHKRRMKQLLTVAIVAAAAAACLALVSMVFYSSVEDLAESQRQDLYAARTQMAYQALLNGANQEAVVLLDENSKGMERGRNSESSGWEWRFLRGYCSKASVRLSAEQDSVNAFAYSDSYLASAGDDGVVRIWKLSSRELLDTISGNSSAALAGTLEGGSGPVRALAWQTGRRLAVASDDGTVVIWDVEKRVRLCRFAASNVSIRCIAFGKTTNGVLAAVDNTGRISVWTLNKDQDGTVSAVRLADMEVGIEVTSIDFHGDDKWLVVGRMDALVEIFDVSSDGRLLTHCRLRGHDGPVTCVRFLIQSSRVVSGGADGTVRLWDVAGKGQMFSLAGHSAGITSVDVYYDNLHVLSSSLDGTIRIWNLAKQVQVELLGGLQGEVSAAAVASDGQYIAAVEGSGRIVVWGLPRTRLAHTWEVEDGTYGLAFHPTENRVAFVTRSGSLKVFDLDTGNETISRSSLVGVWADAITWNDRWIGLSDRRGRVILLNDKTGELVQDFNLNGLRGSETGNYQGLAFSPDGRLLAARLATKHDVILVDIPTARIVHRFSGHSEWVVAATFSCDSALLATCSSDMSVRVWDVRNQGILYVFKEHIAPVLGVAFSPGGEHLASCGWDKQIILWDLAAGRKASVLTGHTGGVVGLAFTRDGQRLASGGTDRTVRIWNTRQHRLILTFSEHAEYVSRVAFGPNDNALASTSPENRIHIWESHSIPKLVK